jgi:hypothetical protein
MYEPKHYLTCLKRVSVAKPLWVSDHLDDFAAYG